MEIENRNGEYAKATTTRPMPVPSYKYNSCFPFVRCVPFAIL